MASTAASVAKLRRWGTSAISMSASIILPVENARAHLVLATSGVTISNHAAGSLRVPRPGPRCDPDIANSTIRPSSCVRMKWLAGMARWPVPWSFPKPRRWQLVDGLDLLGSSSTVLDRRQSHHSAEARVSSLPRSLEHAGSAEAQFRFRPSTLRVTPLASMAASSRANGMRNIGWNRPRSGHFEDGLYPVAASCFQKRFVIDPQSSCRGGN